jgi:hypothetical protein
MEDNMLQTLQTSSPRPSRKVNVIFKEGGIKLFCYPGALQALAERGYEIEHAEAGSCGTFAATFAVNGKTPDELLASAFEGLEGRHSLHTLLMALTPADPINLALGGFFDLRPGVNEILERYKLEAKDNLTIVTYDLLRHRIVRHKGRKQNLTDTISASCALLPTGMRPVWHYDHETPRRQPGPLSCFWDPFGIWNIWADTLSRISLLVDPGMVAWEIEERSDIPTIVFVLEAATEMPSYELNWLDPYTWIDVMSHVRELIYPYPCTRPAGDASKVVFINLGNAEVSGMNLSAPREILLALKEESRRRTDKALEQAEAEGRLGGVTVH